MHRKYRLKECRCLPESEEVSEHVESLSGSLNNPEIWVFDDGTLIPAFKIYQILLNIAVQFYQVLSLQYGLLKVKTRQK